MSKPIWEYSAKELRALAVGMPYRSEATKAQMIQWIQTYVPERLLDEGDQ